MATRRALESSLASGAVIGVCGPCCCDGQQCLAAIRAHLRANCFVAQVIGRGHGDRQPSLP